MDVLKDKATIQRDYISRYENFSYYYHTIDKKYIQGITAQLDASSPHVVVKLDQSMTLDSLANKYYGRPDYWWIIADFNRIQDPFISLIPRFTEIKIPSIADISYKKVV